jgi:nitrate reductase assembly molybdenum cofactor insertion protein NarJ
MKELLTSAAEWRLLSLLFECPSEHWRATVAASAAEITDDGLREAAAAALAEATAGLYHSIFGPGGPAAPREVSYHQTLQLGYLMSEIKGYYQAFAYQPDTSEAADHVAVEAGFVAYLRLKEAYARQCGDEEGATITAEAAQRFLDHHLANVAEPLARALAQSGVRYLALAGEALATRVGPPLTKSPLHVLSDVEECAFDCGDVP